MKSDLRIESVLENAPLIQELKKSTPAAFKDDIRQDNNEGVPIDLKVTFFDIADETNNKIYSLPVDNCSIWMTIKNARGYYFFLLVNSSYNI